MDEKTIGYLDFLVFLRDKMKVDITKPEIAAVVGKYTFTLHSLTPWGCVDEWLFFADKIPAIMNELKVAPINKVDVFNEPFVPSNRRVN